ncbi:MAG: cyclic nucleotide-binding domain-containing protein [Nitrospiraceae bacterium]|nr:MAG: cyclic nucleotide-binding domain-containing protein [Nitrospiraceae bacterium]
MSETESIFQQLSKDELKTITTLGIEKTYGTGELIFSEGDTADYIYFIQSGQVSISIQKFTEQEEICTLGPGEYFGEMAVFYKNKRTASVTALTEARLLSVDKKVFLQLVKTDREIARKINTILARRNEELIFKEKLLDSTGINSRHLHVSIKGDPSLRETTFTRERHESIVDKVLPQLKPGLEDLLLNRCVYQIFIGFNSGEIRTLSIFDPFSEEIHQANKLADEAYIDRHFPLTTYDEKTQMLRRLYAAVAADPVFGSLPEPVKKMFMSYYEHWEPITRAEIATTLSRLSVLRSIPHYYLRNFTISMTRDAIRMQFNCDGTHIVSAQDYQRFIDENL